MPTRSPGPSRQVACESSSPLTALRSTSSTSMTSLPSRWVANRCSSSRSRGGGSSSIRAVGGVDPELRLRRYARAPRAVARRAPCAPGCDGVPPTRLPAAAARPWRARTPRTRPRSCRPTPSWTSQVRWHTASRNHRSWVTTTSADGSDDEVLGQPGHGLDVEVVGRLVEDDEVVLVQQQLGERAPAPLAAGQPDHGAVELDPGEQLGDDLAGPRLGGPRVVGLAGRARRRAPSGCRRGCRPGGGSRSPARATS